MGKTMHHYFCLFQMVNGAVQYTFDCGSGQGLVRVGSIRIDDGQWHHITVERRGRTAEVTIDDKASAESSAPGTNDLLNLDRYAAEHRCKSPVRLFSFISAMVLETAIFNKHLQINPFTCSHDVYFGAEVDTGGMGFEDVRKGFEGCMKAIKIGGKSLPYSGSSEVGTLQKFEKVEFHCKRSYVPGRCTAVYFALLIHVYDLKI